MEARPAADRSPRRLPTRFEPTALETDPFPRTVLFQKVAHGQLDSGSGEGQSTNRKLELFLGEAATSVRSKRADSGIRGSGWLEWSKPQRNGQSERARPLLVQLGIGLHPRRSISTVHKTFHVESLLAAEHVINGASDFMSQCGQRLRFAVFLFQACQVSLALRVVAKKSNRGFRERPL